MKLTSIMIKNFRGIKAGRFFFPLDQRLLVVDLIVQQKTDLLDCLRTALYNDNHHYKERGPGDPS